MCKILLFLKTRNKTNMSFISYVAYCSFAGTQLFIINQVRKSEIIEYNCKRLQLIVFLKRIALQPSRSPQGI